ncbi:MAG: HNH endonuclease [Lewinellaceae bacterium]|nr:HNH endonuclease [Lewinellaceae bacterium]
MRPIERGPWPLDMGTNVPKQFREYGLARRDLIERMGQYCSYCETRLNASLAVEHVQPKAHTPGLKLDWFNFLLACTNCNSTKGDKAIRLADYYWPDIHNTYLPYVYNADGKIAVSPILNPPEITKAQAMLDLVGLQKYPNTDAASDRRWINRKEAFEKAIRSRQNLAEATTHGVRDLFIDQLIIAATSVGFFSVWFLVFKGHDDVLAAILEAFPGTHQASFDVNNHFIPIRRGAEM